MGKMQFLGVIAVVLAVYNVHATVYFREEFPDGGKFGLDFFPVTKACNPKLCCGGLTFILCMWPSKLVARAPNPNNLGNNLLKAEEI